MRIKLNMLFSIVEGLAHVGNLTANVLTVSQEIAEGKQQFYIQYQQDKYVCENFFKDKRDVVFVEI